MFFPLEQYFGFIFDLCKIFWVYFCILYDIDNKSGLLKKPRFPHFPINKMFVALVGWGQMIKTRLQDVSTYLKKEKKKLQRMD